MELEEKKEKQRVTIEEREATCKELPVLQRDHDACIKCGFKGCLRKFKDEEADILHRFCVLE